MVEDNSSASRVSLQKPSPGQASDARLVMRQCIQKVATGPNYSKDLSYEETRQATEIILNQAVDPVQAGIFLIALRMKRETDAENKGMLQALIDATYTVVADVDELFDVADAYDGYTRGIPMVVFIPAVLAALGIPALTHGLQTVGPKFGVTQRMILHSAGAAVDVTAQQAAQNLAHPDIGWAYVDQSQFCPALHHLVELRTQIVKRSCLTTVEVLTGPIRARTKTHLMTGYVHKAYPPVYAELARFAGFDSALIVRGVEGGVIPSLQSEAKVYYYHDKGAEQNFQLQPRELGIEQSSRAVPLPTDMARAKVKGDKIATEFNTQAVANLALEKGLAALAGKPGPGYDSLVLGAALCLNHLARVESLAEGARQARGVLNSGAALARFKALLNSK